MGPDLGIVQIVNWVTIMFPSLAQYTKIVTPILVLTVGFIGVFFNILPEPGKLYPVPSVKDLETELKDQGRVVYRLALISRNVTIKINRFIQTPVYKWFYLTTAFCSKVFHRLRGKGTKSSSMTITKPKPYQIDWSRLKNRKNHSDKK